MPPPEDEATRVDSRGLVFNVFNNGCPNFRVTDRFEANVSAVSLDKITTGAWHHLAGVYDGSAVMLYVDGILKGTKKFDGDLDA